MVQISKNLDRYIFKTLANHLESIWDRDLPVIRRKILVIIPVNSPQVFLIFHLKSGKISYLITENNLYSIIPELNLEIINQRLLHKVVNNFSFL